MSMTSGSYVSLSLKNRFVGSDLGLLLEWSPKIKALRSRGSPQTKSGGFNFGTITGDALRLLLLHCS